MSSVWVCIPSARPPAEVKVWAKAWIERGYKIALWRDEPPSTFPVDLVLHSSEYPGYAKVVNHLVAQVRALDSTASTAEWFVIGGDDVFPDPNHTAEEIARECREHFLEARSEELGMVTAQRREEFATFGVMQPTGDRWGENPNHPREDMRSAYIDRVAGSAWLGREFCKRVNQGNGPLWPEYKHMFVDEELRHVAVKLGIYWERRDLTHLHQHAGRRRDYDVTMIPEHLKKWTTGAEGQKHWNESEAIFFKRRAAGFPGSEPA